MGGLLKLGLGTTPILVWFKDCWGCSLGLESLLVLLLKLQKTDDDVRVNLLLMTYKGEFLGGDFNSQIFLDSSALIIVSNHLQRNKRIKQRRNEITCFALNSLTHMFTFSINLKMSYFSFILLHSSKTAHIMAFALD